MSEPEDDDLATALPPYLERYSSYPRAQTPQQDRGGVIAAGHRRGHLLRSSAVALLAAIVIAIPVGVTLLLRSGGTPFSTRTVQGPPLIMDLHMFTPTAGWAWGGGSDILHTTLGVQQWTLVPPPIGQLHVIEIAWVDGQSARILASSGSTDFVGTYRLVAWSTNDGGATWQEGQPFTALDETSQGIYGATDLDFIDRTHGWFFDTQDGAVGAPIFIFRTVDGGMHWSRVEMTPSPGAAAAGMLPVDCAKNGLTFLNASTGWVAGYCVGGGPFFDVTHDGGATWRAQPIGCAGGCFVNPPQFTSALDGVLVAGVSSPILFTTSDGGRTWIQRADLPASFVQFINADDGFTLGLTGNDNPSAVLWTTHDGGRSWHQAARSSHASGVRPDTDIDQIDFVNADLGWVTRVDISSQPPPHPTPDSAPVTFWQTENAGASWSLITPRFVQAVSGKGLVLGTLDAVGGPAPGAPRPLPGTITLLNSNGTRFTATAGSNGTFSVRVPPGSYTITGRSPLYDSGTVDCQSIEPVTVGAGASTHLQVLCQEK